MSKRLDSIISVVFLGVELKGMLLYENELEFCVKLRSGYQVVLLKEHCSEVSIEEVEFSVGGSDGGLKKKGGRSGLPRIALLHTGGDYCE